MATVVEVANCGSVLPESIIQSYNRTLIRAASRSNQFTAERSLEWWQTLLFDVIKTTEEVRISNSHRATACDALTVLLKNGVQSPEPAWASFCSKAALWQRILQMYFDRSNDASSKPLKQILDSLLYVLHYQKLNRHENFVKCSDHAVSLCVIHLLDEAAAGMARPAMLVLERLINDKTVSIRQVVSFMPLEDTRFQFSTREEDLVSFIFTWAKNPDLARVCGKVLRSICSDHHVVASETAQADGKVPASIWIMPLRAVLLDNPDVIGIFEKYILPEILSVSRASSITFSHDLPLHKLWEGNTGMVPEVDIRLCLMILRVSRDLNDMFLEEDKVGEPSSPLLYQDQILVNLLTHPVSDIKLTALSILLNQKQTTHPTKPEIVQELRHHVAEFFDESDPRVRNEYIPVMRRFFQRCETAAKRLHKSEISFPSFNDKFWYKSLPEGKSDVNTALLANVGLLEVYEDSLTPELAPTASFQRHFLALKTLSILRSLDLPVQATENSARRPLHLHLLLNLIMDPFEDIRAQAANLICASPPEMELMALVMSNAERLMRESGRADHADGYGRLVEARQKWREHDLLRQSPPDVISFQRQDEVKSGSLRQALSEYLDIIDDLIGKAESDLRQAIADAPLHGNIIALRYLMISCKSRKTMWSAACGPFAGPSELCQRIGKIGVQTWSLVKPILCDDSPEGNDFLGSEEEDIVEVGVKDTLSYAWRALKESSLLTQAMFVMLESTKATSQVDLDFFGNLIFTQLAQLRHRGAFSSVAQTFSTFATFCVKHCDDGGVKLLTGLYSKTLDCVLDKGDALTRRSAGIPALMVGILCAEPEGPLTTRALEDLKDISLRPAENENAIGLPQVHALNCMKDIFLNSRLGPHAESELSNVFEIAVRCLDNDTWAIRNSGLMLLKALLIRLEEGRLNNANKHAARATFSKSAYVKHERLADITLNLLESARELESTNPEGEKQARLIERTFPAIEIIERVGVPAPLKQKAITLLKIHLGSPVWAMRQKTAACLALLMHTGEIVLHIGESINQGVQNSIHGSLLLIRYAIQAMGKSELAANFWKLAAENLDVLEVACKSHSNDELLFENLLSCLRRIAMQNGSRKETIHANLTRLSTGANSERLDEILFNGHLSDMKEQFWWVLKSIEPDGVYDILSNPALDIQALRNGLMGLEKVLYSFKAKEVSAIIIWLETHDFPNEVDLESTREVLASINRSLLSLAKSNMCIDLSCETGLANALLPIALRSSNQSLMDEAIRLWGIVVAVSLQHATCKLTYMLIEQWLELLHFALADQLNSEVRKAALDSIENFRIITGGAETFDLHPERLMPLALVIYDGIVDDSDELRVQAAGLASWIMPMFRTRMPVSKQNTVHIATNKALSPASARRGLLGFLPRYFVDSHLLYLQAVRRVLGCTADELLCESFSFRFTAANQKRTTLFDEERQNQYIDEAQEVEDWSKILNNLDCKHSVGTPTIDALTAWALEGLANFVPPKTGIAAVKRLFAPLGILSHLDAYILCLRLLKLSVWLLSTKERPDWNLLNQLRETSCSIIAASSDAKGIRSNVENGKMLGTLSLDELAKAVNSLKP